LRVKKGANNLERPQKEKKKGGQPGGTSPNHQRKTNGEKRVLHVGIGLGGGGGGGPETPKSWLFSDKGKFRKDRGPPLFKGKRGGGETKGCGKGGPPLIGQKEGRGESPH